MRVISTNMISNPYDQIGSTLDVDNISETQAKDLKRLQSEIGLVFINNDNSIIDNPINISKYICDLEAELKFEYGFWFLLIFRCYYHDEYWNSVTKPNFDTHYSNVISSMEKRESYIFYKNGTIYNDRIDSNHINTFYKVKPCYIKGSDSLFDDTFEVDHRVKSFLFEGVYSIVPIEHYMLAIIENSFNSFFYRKTSRPIVPHNLTIAEIINSAKIEEYKLEGLSLEMNTYFSRSRTMDYNNPIIINAVNTSVNKYKLTINYYKLVIVDACLSKNRSSASGALQIKISALHPSGIYSAGYTNRETFELLDDKSSYLKFKEYEKGEFIEDNSVHKISKSYDKLKLKYYKACQCVESDITIQLPVGIELEKLIGSLIYKKGNGELEIHFAKDDLSSSDIEFNSDFTANSGITISTGIDLGARGNSDKNYIERLMNSWFTNIYNSNRIDKLTQVLYGAFGKKKSDAWIFYFQNRSYLNQIDLLHIGYIKSIAVLSALNYNAGSSFINVKYLEKALDEFIAEPINTDLNCIEKFVLTTIAYNYPASINKAEFRKKYSEAVNQHSLKLLLEAVEKVSNVNKNKAKVIKILKRIENSSYYNNYQI